MSRWTYLGIFLSVSATVAALVFLGFYPDQRLPTAVAFTVGVPATLFTTFIIYLLQVPDFEAEAKEGASPGKRPGEPAGVITARWTHLTIRNTSVGFLGGGTAAGVTGILIFERESEGKQREFRTKWETKPNPLRITPLLIPGELPTPIRVTYFVGVDDTQIEASREEALTAGQAKSLDVAVKFQGDAGCYISIPENFRFEGLRNPAARYPPGRYTFRLFIEFTGGKRRLVGTFVLRNEESEEAATISVEKIR